MSNEKNSKFNEIWNDKKKRGRLYYVIFFVILAVLFLVNNLNSGEGEGPYPPDYWKLKNSANQSAPLFTLKTIDDSEVSLESYKGKVVLLEFWATWCNSCQKMTKDLIELKEKYKDYEFEIVSISMDEFTNHSKEDVKQYIESKGINYPVLLGDQITSNKYGNVKDIPVIYMIKKDGKIYTRYDGWTPKSILDRDITLLLK